MRLHVPLAITFLVGIFMVMAFFMPHKAVADAAGFMQTWGIIIVAFAMVLGVGSLLQRHTERIRRRRPEWGYSVVTLACFFGMLVLGFSWGKEKGSPFDWVFNNIQVPLDATMFSLLAFFVASAAYRSFRARSGEATLMLLAAVVVMLGRVPLGEQISHKLPAATEWIMSVPTIAAKRGIIFGAALGALATSYRIIAGLERSHLGGEGGR